MDPFATVEELQERLDWELDEGEQRDAEGALDELSHWARHYGDERWTVASAPGLVKSLVLGAAKRYMKHSEGYVQSRAGDETLAWTDRGEEAGSPTFTKAERASLRRLSKTAAFGSIGIVAYGRAERATVEGLVPTDSTPFPYFRSDVSPW
ncbi:MAG: hypothetical protein ACRCYU_12205 [Nocardioides sp.]